MAFSSGDNRLEELLRSLELKTLDAGTKLYRGSFEGQPNEDWEKPFLRGLKCFTHDEFYALEYAKRIGHPTYIVPREGARGVLYCAEIIEPFNILEFPEDGEMFRKYTCCQAWLEYYARASSRENNFLQFERSCLMPIMRQAWGDNISGYMGPSGTEVLVDLDSIKCKFTVQPVIE